MTYNEALAQRIRKILRRRKGFSEKKMFGGICFLLNGNMCCGTAKGNLMLRLGKELAAEALNEPHTREMDFTGKPIKSMIYVEPTGYADDENLEQWVRRAAEFTSSLPKK